MKDPKNYAQGSAVRKRLASAEKQMKIPNTLLPKRKVTTPKRGASSIYTQSMKNKNNDNYDLLQDSPTMFSMSNTGGSKNRSKSPKYNPRNGNDHSKSPNYIENRNARMNF